MKINRLYKVLAGVALFCTSLTACKSYLDLQPISEFDNQAVFSNVSNATLAVLGAYDLLSGDNTYGIRISLYYPYDSDEMMVSGAVDNGRRGIGRYNALAGNTEIANPWNNLYQGIERANLCIEQIPKMDLYMNGSAADQKELRRLHGEALTLRAQYYLELIRNWGDVPAPMVPAYQQANLFVEKEDRDKVYEKLIADLKTAADLLPWRTDAGARNERITKGAAKALRARIALYRGGYSLRRDSKVMERRADYATYYQIARDETNDLMQRRDQHTLNTDYVALFKTYVNGLTPDPAAEIMFEVGSAGGSAQSDSKLGYYNGPRLDAASRYGQGGGGINPLPTYFYAFDSTDVRRDVTITIYQVLATNIKNPQRLTTITDGKFRRDWRNPILSGTSQNLGYNWPLIRFSDVLLMFAEAENELKGGPTAQAIAAFEEVRKRGYAGKTALIGPTPTTKEAFFNAIVNERFLEFGGEGIRKYDLIRWNLLSSKITEARANLTDMQAAKGKYVNVPQYLFWKNNGEEIQFLNSFYKPSTATTVAGWTRLDWRQNITATYITSVAQFFTPNKSELLPINQAALDANPKLTQDYGY
ncbi:RagB/SusD family nutrient uptake outer membrane protein [Fibrella forsythiae]|uniref:RagB/SusD family nutrient uptake outer membrane protein n=1 Tax=Fibrella forsythiae TaxID=2817061 RepID=A0ABS3JP97_9BACT|nr:RagB/SusD family nutrient uptake outer membrane protein [Fibrella forsythiae]MBO0951313.1 RagB/SusD family nutrient uptake outer membrane protein [Fibrella forsythiae]